MAHKETSEIAVRVDNIHKDFYLPHEKSASVKSSIVHMFQKKDKDVDTQHALQGLSFTIKKGDFFGIVGRNGSGKSTLLKIIAEIYQPTKGKVHVNGKLIPFIELGVGFNPELTGRENVYLNGALFGFSKKEIDERYESIVKFAELEEFMDQKLKNYSSGMQVRLAFSVAIQADADILLLDEVLAVGDEAFQRKCNDYFKKLKDNKKTVILVTHSMDNIRKFCNKAMMIQDGKIKAIGSPEDIANEYSIENVTATSKDENISSSKSSLIESIKVDLISPLRVSQNDKIILRYTIVANKDMTARVVMDLWDVDNNYSVYCDDSPTLSLKADSPVSCEALFDISPLNDMSLIAHTSVRDKDDNILIFANEANSPTCIIRRTDYKVAQAGALYKDGKNTEWR